MNVSELTRNLRPSYRRNGRPRVSLDRTRFTGVRADPARGHWPRSNVPGRVAASQPFARGYRTRTGFNETIQLCGTDRQQFFLKAWQRRRAPFLMFEPLWQCGLEEFATQLIARQPDRLEHG